MVWLTEEDVIDKMYQVRESNIADTDALLRLYYFVAATGGGIARNIKEIDRDYIEHCQLASKKSGVQFVIDDPQNPGEIIAEIHCYALVPGIFSHVLSELTILVSPQHQGSGLGKLIFSHLLSYIEHNRPDILRVELAAKESNQRAIGLYQQLGFKIEGRFERRINSNGAYEADIPMAWFNKNFNQEKFLTGN
ncbi:MAG: GNAT family N-acetyltransferase [Ferruginibacter sp.]